jgi:hypothetical protein
LGALSARLDALSAAKSQFLFFGLVFHHSFALHYEHTCFFPLACLQYIPERRNYGMKKQNSQGFPLQLAKLLPTFHSA